MPAKLDHQAALRACARQLRWALSPSTFARESCGLTLDAWQTRAADSDAKRVALVCSRAAGKSTVAALKAAHQALFYPGSLTILCAPTLRQSGELFGTARKFLSASKLLPARLPSDNAMSCTLPSGSRIIALPGDNADNVRGFQGVNCVLIDEAAFCDDSLMTAIMPVVATSGGAIWMMSTPNGKRGLLWELVSGKAPGWHFETITAPMCSRISPEFIAEYTRTRGPHAARAELFGEFLEQDGQYFQDEAITAILSASLSLLNVTF